jgi:hypothetical protein
MEIICGCLAVLDNMKKVFVRKNGSQKGGGLYKWSPDTSVVKNKKKDNFNNQFFCLTPLGGQGNDFVSTYSYVIVIESGKAIKTAYVQCDYVK